jgi:hypothetical protein
MTTATDQRPDYSKVAALALANGICPLPAMKGKRPAVRWEPYQHRRPAFDEFRWNTYPGIGLLAGAVSGGLEMLELEGRFLDADLEEQFIEAAKAAGLEALLTRIVAGYCESTPKGGRHMLYFCDDVPGSFVLAAIPGTPQLPLIETRGEAGFIVIAPSGGVVHPTGKPWELIIGGLDTIARITVDERAALHAVCRSFDLRPAKAPMVAPAAKPSSNGDERPGDRFNWEASWGDVLVGWELVDQAADGTDYWRRPGKGDGHSATTNHEGTDRLKVFSSSTPFDTGGTYDKFGALAILEHGGDLSAAARALAAASGPTTKDAATSGVIDVLLVAGPGSEVVADEIGAAAGVVPAVTTITELPDTFWNARPQLEHIRTAAHSRLLSAPAVLHAVLARIAAQSPHTIELPPIVGTTAPLCFFATLIAAPGVGKSSANGVAAALVPNLLNDGMREHDQFADQLPLGSGEGLVDVLCAFVKEETADGKKNVKRQVRNNAFVFVDEGQVLAELGGRSGSTLLPTLRTIWSGGVLGSTNASAERKRLVPGGGYSFGVVVAIQEGHAGALLNDVAAGTPQRFAWARGTDPTVPDVSPDWPGPLGWELPGFAAMCRIEDQSGRWGDRHPLPVAPEIVDEIRDRSRSRIRGETTVDQYDAHSDLLRLKMAALLAILDGRLDVGIEDWRLAEVMKNSSDAVRDSVIAIAVEEARQKESATSARHAARHVAADTAIEESRTFTAARKIAAKVHDEPDRWTVRTMQQAMRRYRDEFTDALDHATDAGWITEHAEPGSSQDKRALRPGPKSPT